MKYCMKWYFGDVNVNARLCFIELTDRWDLLIVAGFISISTTQWEAACQGSFMSVGYGDQ